MNIKNYLFSALIFLLLILFVALGYLTIPQAFIIQSEPTGANLVIDNLTKNQVTPYKISVSRLKPTKTLSLSADGYLPLVKKVNFFDLKGNTITLTLKPVSLPSITLWENEKTTGVLSPTLEVEKNKYKDIYAQNPHYVPFGKDQKPTLVFANTLSNNLEYLSFKVSKIILKDSVFANLGFYYSSQNKRGLTDSYNTDGSHSVSLLDFSSWDDSSPPKILPSNFDKNSFGFSLGVQGTAVSYLTYSKEPLMTYATVYNINTDKTTQITNLPIRGGVSTDLLKETAFLVRARPYDGVPLSRSSKDKEVTGNELYLLRYEGGTWQKKLLTEDMTGDYVSVSPSGNRVAYFDTANLYVYDPDRNIKTSFPLSKTTGVQYGLSTFRTDGELCIVYPLDSKVVLTILNLSTKQKSSYVLGGAPNDSLREAVYLGDNDLFVSFGKGGFVVYNITPPQP